jgi:hypothetical protein
VGHLTRSGVTINHNHVFFSHFTSSLEIGFPNYKQKRRNIQYAALPLNLRGTVALPGGLIPLQVFWIIAAF